MKIRTETARPRWFALLTALWLVFGTLLLALLTAFNGWPIPAGVPEQPLPLLGFLVFTASVYLLPVWLTLKERQYAKQRGEPPSYGSYAFVALTLSLLWGLLLSPWILG